MLFSDWDKWKIWMSKHLFKYRYDFFEMYENIDLRQILAQTAFCKYSKINLLRQNHKQIGPIVYYLNTSQWGLLSISIKNLYLFPAH